MGYLEYVVAINELYLKPGFMYCITQLTYSYCIIIRLLSRVYMDVKKPDNVYRFMALATQGFRREMEDVLQMISL